MRQTIKNFGFSYYLCLIGIYEKVCAKFAPILTRIKYNPPHVRIYFLSFAR
jgi:hypothetical protein